MKRIAVFSLSILLAASTSLFAATNNNSITIDNNSKLSTNTTISADERAKIQEVVRQYLLDKPEVIVESLQNFQKKQYEEAEKTVQQTQKDAPKYVDALFRQANDPIFGNPNGKITIVEFFDYQCPHCVEMVPVIEAVLKSNPNVRVIYKDWPIRGTASEFAAKAALAANKQGKYLQLNRAIFKIQPPLTQEKVLEAAKSAGLDMAKLQKDINDPSIQSQVKANMQLAKDLKLFGTPAFFFTLTDAKNGAEVTYIPGQLNEKQMQEVISKLK